ncbi:MAG: peptide chain release factor-like protein [Verrucomicrobiota bacterium]
MTPLGLPDELIKRMHAQGIFEDDLEEVFARSSGPGGQNVNKVSTSVTLKHLPTSVVIRVQTSRSQSTNRRLARERLVTFFEKKREKGKLNRQAQQRRKRIAKAKRPKNVQEQILKQKKRRSIIKRLRKVTTNDW